MRGMRKADTPCYGCEDRQVGCHGSCKLYFAFKKRLDEINEKIYKDKEVAIFDGYRKSKFRAGKD